MSEFGEGLIGIVLDERYRLDAVLGEGGMGAVFRATHLEMDRKVAVKLLKPHLTADETQQQRFVREARSTMKVDSPHVVKIFDFGVTPHRDYYMVLEYLDGRTVQRELDVDGAFAPARAVHIARQALAALGAAHQSGLVHRDIKPDNLLLMRVGADADYTKVLDFGVAKLMQGAIASERSAVALTQQGMVFGTPEFMSPEQAVGTPLDGRSDLYALAATLFAMLTGSGMYDAVTAFDWLVAHVKQPAPHLADFVPALARYPELDAALQQCLAKDRDRRPPTAEAMDALLAAVEPTLTRGVGDLAIQPTQNPPQRKRVTASASSYISAVGAALEPTAEEAALEPGAEDSIAALLPSRRRPVLLALGGVLLAGSAIAAIALATAQRAAPRPTASGSAITPSSDGALGSAALVAVDGAVASLVAVVAVDAVEADASRAATKASSGTRPSPKSTSATRPTAHQVSEHLAAAEAAAKAGNHLRQLAEADLALRADPKSARARFLLGDALVATGDLERGCTYLRKLKHDSQAAARAAQAGCASD